MEKRKNMDLPIELDIDSDPNLLKHSQSMSGPAMLFVELVKPKTNKYSEDDILDMTGIWKDLLHSGGISVSFYNIEENRVLASLQKGWDGPAVKDFLLTQNEVIKVTWDNIDYEPNKEEDTDIKRKNTKKKSKKKKKTKTKV